MSIAAPSDRLLVVMNPAYMVAAVLSAAAQSRRRASEEAAMQYLCLIYEDEKEWQKLPPAQSEKILGEYSAYTESVKRSGNYSGGNALESSRTATTVRVRQGRVADHGRTVCRDQGTTRWLLPAAGSGPERGDPARLADSRRAFWRRRSASCRGDVTYAIHDHRQGNEGLGSGRHAARTSSRRNGGLSRRARESRAS